MTAHPGQQGDHERAALRWQGVWRIPSEETLDLYPGLVVCDDRVSGSITISRSRLPLWAISYTAITDDWGRVTDGWPTAKEITEEDFATFIYDILELRGEFARLLLVLADAERCERVRSSMNKPWWRTKKHRKRVLDQLQRCSSALTASSSPGSTP